MTTPIRGIAEMEQAQANPHLIFNEGVRVLEAQIVSFQLAASDLSTALTSGTNNAYFRAPHSFTLLAVRASVLTVSSSGAITVDINKNGVTMLSTKITIDEGEKSSEAAATPPVIDATAGVADVADDDELTVDIDGAGTDAAGLIVTLIGEMA